MVSGKERAALGSVAAAVFLTSMKLLVGIFTGSLGILSEALHSTLDLCAAVITFFAVKLSDKPADREHHYGHGKIESFSALIETVLLLITCCWIVYEALEKLFFGKSVELQGIQWGLTVIFISILVDASRARILKKAAVEHGSMALEADALHFSSDVWSSSVVMIGLVFVWIGNSLNIPLLKYADPAAALGVALLVIRVSIKLGRETVDVLLDTAPEGMKEMIEKEIGNIPGVLKIREVRVRPSGPIQYIDLNIGIDPNQSHMTVHTIVHEIRENILKRFPKSDILVSTFPVASRETAGVCINDTLEKIIRLIPACRNVHNIHVYELDGKKTITAHVEINENLTLKDSYEMSNRVKNMVRETQKDIDNVSLYFECAEQTVLTEDITGAKQELVTAIREAFNKRSNNVDCHDIKLYRNGDKISIFLHCGVRGNFTVDRLELISSGIKSDLRKSVTISDNVYIQFEPVEEML